MIQRNSLLGAFWAIIATLAVSVSGATANGFGVVDRVFVAPTATYETVPTSYLETRSYSLAPSYATFAPTYYETLPTSTVLSTTAYRPWRRGLFGALFPSRYLIDDPLVVPTRSYASPTRYYVDDLVTTTSLGTTYAYPTTSILYGSGLLPTTVICRDGPIVGTVPAGVVRSPTDEPPLLNSQSGRPAPTSNGGRGAALESRPNAPSAENSFDSEPSAPVSESPAQPQSGIDESLIPNLETTPPPIPESSGDVSAPFRTDVFESSDSMRPAFGGGLSGSAAASLANLVEGRVRSETAGASLEGLTVRFSNAVPSFTDRQTVTDARGNFRLPEFLPDGDWSVVISSDSPERPTRTYPQITVMGGRIYDRLGRDYSKLVLNY